LRGSGATRPAVRAGAVDREPGRVDAPSGPRVARRPADGGAPRVATNTARLWFPTACAPRFGRSYVKSTRSTRRSERSTKRSKCRSSRQHLQAIYDHSLRSWPRFRTSRLRQRARVRRVPRLEAKPGKPRLERITEWATVTPQATDPRRLRALRHRKGQNASQRLWVSGMLQRKTVKYKFKLAAVALANRSRASSSC
jgi:hypothetical protein